MKTTFKLLPIILLFSFYSQAQTGSITGLIQDAKTGEVLIGATVFETNSGLGTSTDSKGKFNLKGLPHGEGKLQIRFFGYSQAEIQCLVNSSDDEILKIELSPGSYQLKDIDLSASNYQAQSSISQLDVQMQAIKSSQDVLRIIPGLFIGQHAGGGKAEQIFLRGFDIDHGTDIALSLDGIPVNMVSHAHGQGYSDLHFIIPETIERVEFDKGPYYADQGNFNTAGYADFQTIKTLENNLVKVEGGQFGRFRALGMVNLLDKQNNNSSLFLASEFLRSDGYFESPQNFNRFNSFLKARNRISEQQSLEFSFSAFSSGWTASGQIPERAVSQGLISRFGAIDDTEGGQTQRFNANAELISQLPNDAILKNQFYASHYNFRLASNFTFFLENPVLGDQITQSEGRFIYGTNNSYSQNHSLFQLPAKASFGTGIRYDDVNDVRLYRSAGGPNDVEDLSRGNIDEGNFHFYMDEKVKLSQNFALTAGLRYDYFDFRFEDQLNNNTSNRSEMVLSPKLQLSYDLSEELNFYFKYGRGFHSNDARAIASNSQLQVLPQAQGFDLGSFWKINDKLLFNLAFWQLHSEEELVFVGDAGIVEPSGATNRFGFDFGLRYEALEWLSASVDANYSLARSLDAPSGEDYIPLAPGFSSLGRISARKSKFKSSLQYRFLADRAANEDRSLVAEGYFIVDWNLNYRIGPVELGISIENIFNEEWKEAQFETTSQLQNETEPVTEIHYTPGTPFQAQFSVAYRF